jgi:two-component system nitrogen regulation response regulator GlnG
VVAQHPDPARVGESVTVAAGIEVGLSRLTPAFGGAHAPARPLADVALSRRPWRLVMDASGGLALEPPEGGGRLLVGGKDTTGPVRLPAEAVALGVPLTLADRVTLVAYRTPGAPAGEAGSFGIIGVSAAMAEVHAQVRVFAPHAGPVLLRGESGAGKELVARALHAASTRPQGPFVAVNVAALPPALAASELFGHVRGAFTGASQPHNGLFAAAHGGTLFLDEIGDASLDVQLLLLRAIETGEITPVGSSTSRRVDVRLVAATDAALETAVDAGRFRAPLYHRLAGFDIALPPLRARRADIGLLLHHFITEELAAHGLAARMAVPDPGAPLPVPPTLVHRLITHDWPGNVRQLRNVARQLALAIQTGGQVSFEAIVARTLAWTRSADEHADPSLPATAAVPRGASSPLTEEAVRNALELHDYRLTPAARTLGVARNTLNAWIDAHPTLRRPKDLSAAEIEHALAEAANDMVEAARCLGVSERGLRLRMRELEGRAS